MSQVFSEYGHIATREDFAAFVSALLEDLRENPGRWENLTLPDYLESLAAYSIAISQAYKNAGEIFPETSSWRLFAQILGGAAIYE